MNDYLTVEQAAQALGVGEASVRARISSGELPALELSGGLSIPASAVETARLSADSVPALVVRATDEQARPRTYRERRRAFRQRAGMYPEAYLQRWRDGAVDLDDEAAELAVQAERLVEDAPRTQRAAR